MTEPRTIKRYVNRRLYDLEQQGYTTLKEIRNLVLQDIGFVVIDQQTQTDITTQTLMQILTSSPPSLSEDLTREFLSQVIREQSLGARYP